MNQDVLYIVGILLYLAGAVRTFRWVKRKAENEAVDHVLGRPSSLGLFVACLLGWLFFEAVMGWLWHDGKVKPGFDEQYEVCSTCKGVPSTFLYRPIWEVAKADIICPECNGTGIVRKDD